MEVLQVVATFVETAQSTKSESKAHRETTHESTCGKRDNKSSQTGGLEKHQGSGHGDGCDQRDNTVSQTGGLAKHQGSGHEEIVFTVATRLPTEHV